MNFLFLSYSICMLFGEGFGNGGDGGVGQGGGGGWGQPGHSRKTRVNIFKYG